LTGNSDIKDSLKRLDELTQEEARMARAELLKVTHSVDEKIADVDKEVKGVGKTVKGIKGEVQNTRSDVQDVGSKVGVVEESMQVVQDDMKDVGSTMRIVCGDIKYVFSEFRDVDDKLNQVNRSYSLNPYSLFRELRHIYREAGQRSCLQMAIGPRFIRQSQQCTRSSSRRYSSMVRPGKNVQ